MDARMPEEFYESVVVYLPEQNEPGPKGGRRPIRHHTVLKVIWFVLATGCRWKDVPIELGCCGETARTRLQEWEQAGIWGKVHLVFLTMLRHRGKLDTSTVIIDSTQVRAFGGGDKTGPSPVDRRKKGTKYTLMVDRHGVPLVLRSASANTSDHRQILSTVVAFPHVGGKPGRPKEHPDKLYADAGYDSDPARCILRFLGIDPRIRKRNSSHGSHLGKIRWVVERTISWIKGLRRMRVRYDRKDTILDAWTTMAAAVICFHILQEHIA
jgi:transposase